MALQYDPQFGTADYFKNRDQQRREVNAMRQAERQNRIMVQGLRRNAKKEIRAGGSGAAFMDAATKLGSKLTDFVGFGNDAATDIARKQFDLSENAKEAARAKSELEARRSGLTTANANKENATAGSTGFDTTSRTSGNNANEDLASASNLSSNSKPFSKMSREDQIKSLRPSWADDVKNDKTFKDIDFNDPLALEMMAGKSRAEVYDLLIKKKANDFMAEKTKIGSEMLRQERMQNDGLNGGMMTAEQRDAAQKKQDYQDSLARFEKEQEFSRSPEGLLLNQINKQQAKNMDSFITNLEKNAPKVTKLINDYNSPEAAQAREQRLAPAKREREYKLASKLNAIDGEIMANKLDLELNNSKIQRFRNQQIEDNKLFEISPKALMHYYRIKGDIEYVAKQRAKERAEEQENQRLMKLMNDYTYQ